MGKNTGMAALSYVLGIITAIIVLIVAERKDKFTKFHAMQSLIWNILYLVVGWAIGMLLVPFTIVGIEAIIFTGIFLLWPLYALVGFVMWIVLIVKAYNGEKFKLPVIGDWAEGCCK